MDLCCNICEIISEIFLGGLRFFLDSDGVCVSKVFKETCENNVCDLCASPFLLMRCVLACFAIVRRDLPKHCVPKRFGFWVSLFKDVLKYRIQCTSRKVEQRSRTM